LRCIKVGMGEVWHALGRCMRVAAITRVDGINGL